jgi:uncharacterized membrane protein
VIWLFVVGLAVWVLVIQGRLASAEAQLRDMRRRSAVERPAAPDPVRTATATAAPGAPRAADVAEDKVAAAEALPPTAAPPAPSPWDVEDRPAVEPAPSRPLAPAAARRPGVSLSTWLSENGLAWLGGGALALGGALLAAYAAQQGFFTPALRIAAAIVLGFAMLGAGEWIRRQTGAPGGRHALAAAMASGAGAATLYAAVWAAYALYHFLPAPAAAGVLAAVSLGLLALAFVHGEPLALLALLGAFAAPVVCALPSWNGVALDGYLVLIAATGLAAASLRDWGRAGLLTLGVAALWILARGLSADVEGAGGLVVAMPAIAILAAARRRRLSPPSDTATLLSRLPVIALVGACALWALFAASRARDPALAQAIVGAALAGLAAGAARLDLARPRLLAAPALGLALVAAARWAAPTLAPGANSPLWFLVPIAATAGAGLALVLADNRRAEGAIIGAAAGALALTLLRADLAAATAVAPGLVFIAAGALFLGGAAMIARRSPTAAEDLAVAAWVGAGAEALGLAIHSTLAGRPEPLAYGLLSLVLALASRRLPWRGLPEAAALAALFSLLSLLGARFAGPAMSGATAWTAVALGGGAAVLAQTGAWWTLRGRAGAGAGADAVSTSALVSGLLTAFLVLRLWAAPHGTEPALLDHATEAAFRTVLLLAAGLVLAVRGGASLFARARGPVFLGLGVVHGIALGVVAFNPWWGWATSARPAVPGPPVFDAIAVAYLAPALLLAAAAGRRGIVAARAWAAAALLFAAVWAVMEIRRLFHGPHLAVGDVQYGEAAAYGASLLSLAWLAAFAARTAGPRAASAGVARGVTTVRWGGLILAVWLLCVSASPWWGPLAGAFHAPLLLLLLLVLGVALTLALGRQPAAAAQPMFGTAVRSVAVLEVFSLLTLLIRFAFHGAAMRTPLREASVETWTYSAAWALYGLMILAAGARGGDRVLRWLGLAVLLATTAKVFLFDMATLEGVIRAASFLALGALLLIGALAARRLGAGARSAAPEVEPGP